MVEIAKKAGSELANINSKKLGVAIAAGYVLRDMATCQTQVDTVYPISVLLITTIYIVSQSILDWRKNEKN